MVKLFDETAEIVREHLDYVSIKQGWEWTALLAIRPATVVCREPVNREFVERQYREAHQRLPQPKAKGRAA